MAIVLEKYIALVKKLVANYFTGSITLHFSEGELMKAEVKEVMRNL
tara:strand:- start:21 stop:158 length:138 start_codon:yes stop_codon:yes gene_type:complete